MIAFQVGNSIGVGKENKDSPLTIYRKENDNGRLCVYNNTDYIYSIAFRQL